MERQKLVNIFKKLTEMQKLAEGITFLGGRG